MMQIPINREVLSADSAASSPAGDESTDGRGEDEDYSRAKKNRLREEQRQRRKAVSCCVISVYILTGEKGHLGKLL